MPDLQVIFHHIRDARIPSRGATIAMEVSEIPDPNAPEPAPGKKPHTLKLVHRYAVATTHPKDMFCRHTGRVKAAGRLKSKDQFGVCIPPEELSVFIAHAEDEFNDYISDELFEGCMT